jgi:hypothetical protein
VNPNSPPEELGISLKRFITISALVSCNTSEDGVHKDLLHFRAVARDLLLHAAARDLAPDGFNRFFDQSNKLSGTPTFARRSKYLGDDLVKNHYLNISYHEMILIKGLRPFTMDCESYRFTWVSELKSDIDAMNHGIHQILLPHISMATTEITPASAETIELSLVALLKYNVCSVFHTVFETSSFAEGLATWAAKKASLDILYLASQVGEYNRRIEGFVDFKLQGSGWLCARALVLVAMAFPSDHQELIVCDGIKPL